MKREFLKSLGIDALTDDIIEKIMGEHGKTLKTTTDKLDAANINVTSLQEQLKTRDDDFSALMKSAKVNEEVQKSYDALTEKYNKETEELKKTIKDTQISGALKLSLSGKVHNIDTVTKLLDKEKLSYENDVLKGLDEQLKALQESDKYLFIEEKPPESQNPNQASFPKNPFPPSGNAPDVLDSNPFDKKTFDLGKQVKLYKENPAAAKEMANKVGYKLSE